MSPFVVFWLWCRFRLLHESQTLCFLDLQDDPYSWVRFAFYFWRTFFSLELERPGELDRCLLVEGSLDLDYSRLLELQELLEVATEADSLAELVVLD